ncbi:alpha-glucosidase [[Candida] jaroonii]|uniref:Alpha-glucosidase n=1 Tax=[Candida] jaroonii TaxID=467808 RepID=A0ACA9YCQ2_9ASCO|nr:alpha-glucosidase [[Candida] jaroonii]
MVWWKDVNCYQIWPASFKDSNGDGIGDIGGIITKLDYLKDLGIDVIWLSPMFDSPQDDMGYDISDYEKVYPKYGTLEDMDQLIEGCHSRGMKLILDLVVNHTSSEHQWFKESRSSLDNPKRDWYIWKKPKYDSQGNRQPPNNWKSYFTGSAWKYDEATDEYYLRLYAESQPDLNWENEDCRNAIYDSALKFWYERGIDGFRIDTARLYSKVQTFPDAPIKFPNDEFQPCDMYTSNGPRIHEFHKEMYSKVTSHYDAMTVGEVGNCSREDALKYVSAREKEMNMLFLFDVVFLGTVRTSRFRLLDFTLVDFKSAIKSQCDFIKGTDAWSTVFIENHDQARCISRFAGNNEKSAKMIALLQMTLTGTLFIYQGQEIGMTNLPRSWGIEEYKDIETLNAYNDLVKRNNITDKNDPKLVEFMDAAAKVARDHARSPVQWNSTKHGGFTTGDPWMRVNDNYSDINVENQIDDPHSVLSFYKKILALRKTYKDLFIHGDFEMVDEDNEKTFTFWKKTNDLKALVILNFSNDVVQFEPPQGELLLSNFEIDKALSPWEGRVYIVK